jgi:hypothetical protein
MLHERQIALCERHGVASMIPAEDQKLGWSSTAASMRPIHGLRHPPAGDTCGWYIWGGDHLGDADDFFQPLHVAHLAQICPEAETFLGLPPGWRFLWAPDQVDVWFDPSLLDV